MKVRPAEHSSVFLEIHYYVHTISNTLIYVTLNHVSSFALLFFRQSYGMFDIIFSHCETIIYFR